LLLFSLLLNAFYIPLKLGFENENYEKYELYLEEIPIFILIIDIFVNFNTGIYKKGVLIIDKY
jgi:hypothetical protein